MQLATRQKFNILTRELAAINGVDSVYAKFTVTPSVQQKLVERLQENSSFLQKINLIMVNDQTGETIGMGVGSTIASRTDTSGNGERQAFDPSALDAQPYKCEKVNFDVAIKYAKLDQWAKFPNFYPMFRSVILKRQALDLITIGWNGTSTAATTNRITYPLLQDVTEGWLKTLETEKPDNVLSEGSKVDGKIIVGKNGDYHNIDAAVMDATDELIDEVYQDSTDLVAICGRKMLSDKYFPVVNDADKNTDKLAADMIISQKKLGGLPAVRVPNFPADAILITSLDNLSIYFQTGARRRNLIDNPKRDQIENYESDNIDFVIEELGKAALIKNISLEDLPAPA